MLSKFWQGSQGLNYFGTPIKIAIISTRGMALDKLL